MKRLMYVLTLLAAVVGAASLSLPGHAAEKGKEHRIVFQVDQNDPAVMNLVLNNVQNVVDYYNKKGQAANVEVVAFGPGLNMLREDKSPVKDRLARMVKDGTFPSTLRFSACHNTMELMQKKEGHPIPIVSEARVVPAGVVRISELQEQGWSYVRP